MKRILTLAVLATAFAAVSASAENFVDVYGGTMNFLPTSSLQNLTDCSGGTCTNVPYAGGVQWHQNENVHIQASGVGGVRIGRLIHGDRFSYGGDFSLEGYGVKADDGYMVSGGGYTAQRLFPGGTVVQPGGDFIVGIPVRFFRLYGGVGLNVPIMFYDYQAVSASGSSTNSATGASATIGYDAFFGGRFLLTNNINVFLEDRFGGIFAPIAAKDSVFASNGSVVNGTYVFNSLNSNAIVGGIGFAW